ncbi:WXG100 family type VII secretion target [Streptomyces sp. ISID311]|uniref:WXG100 family type VII secretion target n=1 Tax=Streptomyces sp. ISID311 TaxID=2601673 RepID=UPI0021C3FCD9|nr:WXG100 family type VII secretion target [Streptomyces sp. ISID311]
MGAADKAKEIVQDLTGMWWPEGNEDELREAARAWRTYADDVEDCTAACHKKAQDVIDTNKGKSIEAFGEFWRKYHGGGKGYLDDVATAARDMAKALDKYADQVAEAKKKIEHELEIAGAVLVAGTALALFTGGISEVAAAGATEAIVAAASTAGVAVSATVAEIAGTVLATAAMGGIEAITVDVVVAQGGRNLLGDQHGINLKEASSAGTSGMLFGGAFGAGAGTASRVGRAWGARSAQGVQEVELAGLTNLRVPKTSAEMSRHYTARMDPESTIPAPPKTPGDAHLAAGDPVYYRNGSTGIGYDKATLTNLDLVKPKPGYHDVVIHGNDRGFFEPGRVNAHDKSFSGGNTHPVQIAEAIRNNPSYDGGPVRLISCHSGTNGAGVDSVSAAQQVANELGVPVMAPTNKVGVMPDLGTQQPTIYLDGYWRTFLPVAN